MDKGNAKMPEYEDDPSDSNESTYSLKNTFGAFDVPLMRTPGYKRPLPRQTKNSVAPPMRRI